MDRQVILRDIASGIRKANSTHEKWTKDWWLCDYGVESLMSVKIAENMFRHLKGGESLTMEATFGELADGAGAKQKHGRRPSVLSTGRRADIALWHGNNRLYSVIEVKRLWQKSTCERDLERLVTIIETYGRRRSGSVKHAFFAVFVAGKNVDQVSNKCGDIQAHVEQWCNGRVKVENEPMPLMSPKDNGGSEKSRAWGGIVFMLTASSPR